MAKIVYALIAAWVIASVSAPAHAFKMYSAPEPNAETQKLPPSEAFEKGFDTLLKRKLTCKQKILLAMALKLVRNLKIEQLTPTVIVEEGLWKKLPFHAKLGLAKQVKCVLEKKDYVEDKAKSKGVVGYIDFRSHLTNKILAQWQLYKLVIKY